MIQKCREYMNQYHMVEQQDTIIIGVSGGADSICLLCVLNELSRDWNLRLIAVHVNHGLRGEEADRDERYVKALCEKLKVPFLCYHIDVNRIAKNRKQSEEEAGRDARRAIFESVCRKYKGQKIALAHHADDNGETMLLHLFRGTGLRGLCGIWPVTGQYIRPLLWARKREMETYLSENHMSYCVDVTNESLDYTRNRLRNQVLPYIEDTVNRRAVQHMNDAMEQLREVEAYLEDEAEKAYQQVVLTDMEDDEGMYSLEILEASYRLFPHVIGTMVIQKAIVQVAGQSKDICRFHIEAVEDLLDNQAGRSLNLPYCVEAKRTYKGVRFSKVTSMDQDRTEEEIFLNIPGITKGSNGWQIVCRIFDLPQTGAFPEKPYTKWFDYDTIKNRLAIRTRRAGDRISVYSDGRSQKLKQFLVNRKVESAKRDRTMLIADGDQIVWIVGMRMSSAYQITKQTHKVLEIRIQIDEGESE